MSERDRSKEYARNKAKRRLEALRKSLYDGRWDETSRQNIERRMHNIESALYSSKTYENGKRISGHTKESTDRAVKLLEKLVSSTPIFRELQKVTKFKEPEYDARNEIFKEYMNMSSGDNRTTVTIENKTFVMQEMNVRFFYRFYQGLWNVNDIKPEDRNKVILQKTGFNTLEEAYAVAMGYGDNEQRAEILQKMKNNITLTEEEQIKLYDMFGESQQYTSYKAGATSGQVTLETTRYKEAQSSVFTMTDDEILQALRNFFNDPKFELPDYMERRKV